MPIPVPKDLAAKMRECGLANVLLRAMEELLQEGFGDDGFVESAGTENRKLTEGGEMSGIDDGTRQLPFYKNTVLPDASLKNPALESATKAFNP